jgi:hypothetical protein
MQHYFEYIAELKTEFERDRAKFGDVATAWDAWFQDPSDTRKFESIIIGKTNVAMNFYLKVQKQLQPYNSRMWVYGCKPGEDGQIEAAFAKASTLCQRAENALQNVVDGSDVDKLVDSYFSEGTFKSDNLKGSLAQQFSSVAGALLTRCIVFMPGDVGKSGRDAVAYVDTREAMQALQSSKLTSQFNGNYGIVHINDGFFKPAEQDKPDAKWRSAATVLHELTHLFSHLPTDDWEVGSNVTRAMKQQHGVDSKLDRCYGRNACRALGASYPKRNLENADTLALLAVDISLLRRKLVLADVLALH